MGHIWIRRLERKYGFGFEYEFGLKFEFEIWLIYGFSTVVSGLSSEPGVRQSLAFCYYIRPVVNRHFVNHSLRGRYIILNLRLLH